MKTAVIGSRGLTLRSSDLKFYVPAITTEIVSGGAKGIDTAAKNYAEEKKYKYTELLPNYKKYGRAAPLKRNDIIIDYADVVVAIWDGKSKGTKYTIDKCNKIGKSIIVYYVVCEETGYVNIERGEYLNLSSFSNDMLKEIVIAELDGETEFDINIDLINSCVEAIVENKRVPIWGYKDEERLNNSIKELEEFIKEIVGETDKNI